MNFWKKIKVLNLIFDGLNLFSEILGFVYGKRGNLKKLRVSITWENPDEGNFSAQTDIFQYDEKS